MADGKVKFYRIHGESISAFDNVIAPVYGTGHMHGNTFHFSLTGSTFETAFMLQHVMLTFEGFFNVVDRTGVGTHMYMYERKVDNVMIGYEYPESTLEVVPCVEEQIHR